MSCSAGTAAALNVTDVVLGLQRQDQRLFLGYGVFETTTVVMAALVALYVLVGDPTGHQSAHDISELTVYSMWRMATVYLGVAVAFAAYVVGHEVLHCWYGWDVFWLFLLMLTPWAPVAQQVRLTLGAWPRVRSMMRARAVSNTLAAVMREGFYLGYAGISTAATGRYVFRLSTREVPKLRPLGSTMSGDAEDDIDVKVQKALASSSGLPLTKTALRHGPQLHNVSWKRLLIIRHLLCLDPLAWWWSMDPQVELDDPFGHQWIENPHPPTPTKPQAVAAFFGKPIVDYVGRPLKGWVLAKFLPRHPASYARVRILDVIDELQPGGTVSEPRLLVLERHAVCDRCIMAVRAAVEAFLESSSRQHSGARMVKWFRDVHVKWYGGVAACLDIMWEACFADNSGLRIDAGLRPRRSGAGRDATTPELVSGTELTNWFLLFLFVVCRSLMPEAKALQKVDGLVREGLRPVVFWDKFEGTLRSKLTRTYPSVDVMSKTQSDRAVEELVDEALAETVDRHVMDVLDELCATLIDTTDYQNNSDYLGLARLCDYDTCLLQQPRSILSFTRLPGAGQPRRVTRPRPVIRP